MLSYAYDTGRTADRIEPHMQLPTDDADGQLIIMSGDEADESHDPIHVPAVFISRAHGTALRVLLQETHTAYATMLAAKEQS